MERKEIITFLEDIMELEDANLTEETLLADIVEWDSVARLSMLADAEDKTGKTITPAQVKAFTSVKEVCDYFAG